MKHFIAIITICLISCGQILSQERSDSLTVRFLRQEGVPVTSNNKVMLLMSGREKFTDLFQSIRHAKHHIHLEYFNFRNDSIADALFTLLRQKAEEGVKVRVIFDAFGNCSNDKPLKKHHIRELQKNGIEIVKFDPITFPYINHALHRDHRKIAVIDGLAGYTGGINVADYYIDGLPELGEWRDMHVRIEGDAVRYLQGIFLNMWNKETGQHIGGPAYFPDTPQWPDSITKTIAIVDRTPHVTPDAIRNAYVHSILSAQQSVKIVNPYFLPIRPIRKALKKALKKGTEIEIMIPAVSDIPFIPEASMYIVHKLMKRGAKIYLFNGGFHHSKIMMVDSIFNTVGTANLNSRSLRYDYETNAFIFDISTTEQLTEMFARDVKNSTVLTPEIWKKRSVWKKFVGWIGNLLTPFL